MWISNYDSVDKETHPIVVVSVLNVVLWVLAAVAPFIQVIKKNKIDVWFKIR